MKELTKEDILELLKKYKRYKFHSIVLLIFMATFFVTMLLMFFLKPETPYYSLVIRLIIWALGVFFLGDFQKKQVRCEDKLGNISGIKNLKPYMEAISTVDSTFDFIEYHYWFRNYVFDCYLVEKDNIKLSILHEVMMKNKKGMPYSIHHQESFQKLLKELAQSDNAENDTVKKLKTKILTGERETKKGTIHFIHDRYLFTKIIMVAIYLLAATISGTSIAFNAGNDNKIIISSYNISAAISNLLFYVPLVIVEILVYTGFITYKENKNNLE